MAGSRHPLQRIWILPYKTTSEVDAREKVECSIAVRRGQAAFRNSLLEIYGGKCAITGCDAIPALEAAHIAPYKGEQWNHPANGILLRADIHTLFDLNLIAIDPENHKILLSPMLENSSYVDLKGVEASLPGKLGLQPDAKALQNRYDKFMEVNK